jgi:ACS family tartrate transporter-like MFS transporter
MAKVTWRLLPLMALMYLVNQLDRVNVSFAALTMNRDIGLDTLSYAWGAGIFFIAYFLFEVPSNLVMERVGARRWISRIMISWGLVTGATALVTGASSFLVARFLLGAAEAGFVPGLLLYITYWFPPRYRAGATAVLFFFAPMGNAVAGLMSVPLLSLNGLGLKGWQWMFVAEAVPALLLGLYILVRLCDQPHQARWLSGEEKAWLEAQLETGRQHDTLWTQVRALFDRRVGLLSAIYFFRTMAMYGVSLFLPLMLAGAGLSNSQVGFAATIPFAAAGIGAVIWGWHSDRRDERHWHTLSAMLLAAAGLAAAPLLGASLWSLASLSAAAIGLYAQAVCFWSLPPTMLKPGIAAAGIAAINATGNLGGFVGPYLVGATVRGGNDYSSGLYLMAGSALLSAVLSFVLMRLKWERA